jgi:hypothetical protein
VAPLERACNACVGLQRLFFGAFARRLRTESSACESAQGVALGSDQPFAAVQIVPAPGSIFLRGVFPYPVSAPHFVRSRDLRVA